MNPKKPLPPTDSENSSTGQSGAEDKKSTPEQRPEGDLKHIEGGDQGIIAEDNSIVVRGDNPGVILHGQTIVIYAGNQWEFLAGQQKLSEIERTMPKLNQDISDLPKASGAKTPPATMAAPSGECPFGEEPIQPFGPRLLRQLLDNRLNHPKDSSGVVSGPIRSAHVGQIKCYDQEDIRKHLLGDTQSARHYEISGPSGMGKSHVLHSLTDAEQIQALPIDARTIAEWKNVYVAASPDGTYETIMRRFITELRGGEPCKSSGDCVEDLARSLFDLLKNHVSFLFLLDGADQIKEDELLRLIGDDGPVGARVKEIVKKHSSRLRTLRLAIAVKRPIFTQKQRTETKSRGWRQFSLHALDESHIEDILANRLEREGMDDVLPEEAVHEFAHRIFELSGGHPGIIHTIIDQMAQEGFYVDPDVDADQFFDQFRRFVQDATQEIIGNLDLNEYLFLNIASAFRRFSPDLIRTLRDEGLLPMDMDFTGPEIYRLQDWLDQLQTAALINNDDKWPFNLVVHPVLHHVLPFDLKVKCPEYLQQLYAVGYRIFASRLDEREPGRSFKMSCDARPFFVREMLWLYVQYQLAEPVDPTALDQAARCVVQLVEKQVKDFEASFQFANGGDFRNPRALLDQWRADEQLQELISRLPGGEKACEEIDDLIDSSYHDLNGGLP